MVLSDVQLLVHIEQTIGSHHSERWERITVNNARATEQIFVLNPVK